MDTQTQVEIQQPIVAYPIKPRLSPWAQRAIELWRTTTARQTRGSMSAGESWCALGLLNEHRFTDSFRFDDLRDGIETQCSVGGCGFVGHCGTDLIIHWNDDHCLSFKQIAALAEAQSEIFTDDFTDEAS